MAFLRIRLPGALDPDVAAQRPTLLEPWSPPDLAEGLLAWFDPASGADGAAVTSWADQSSYDRDAIAAGSLTFDADGLDGTPGVVSAGSAFLTTATFSGVPGPDTVLANARIENNPSTGYVIDGQGTNNMSIYRSGSSDTFGARRSTSTAAITKTPSDSSAHSFVFVSDGENSRFYVDGAVYTGAAQGAIAITKLTLGANGAGASAFIGALGDIVWGAGALSHIDCLRADAWLKSRRGLSG